MNFILPFTYTAITTLALILLAIKFFPKLNLMDRPHKYGLKRKPIPYYGGLLLYISIISAILFFVPISKQTIGLISGATLITGIGFLDDKFSISPIIRLFVQFIAATTLVVSGIGILSINLPLIGEIPFTQIQVNGIYLVSAAFTILWTMTIINTINFVDGVSGIVSSTTLISAITLFVLSIHPGIHENPASQIPIAQIAAIIAGACIIFFIFDIPRPKILMGDTGSTLLGFLVATLAIFSGGKVATAFLVLGIPILDMIWVVARRVLNGQKFWKGDLKHLHHRLMQLGMSKRTVVLSYMTISIILGILAVSFVNTAQKIFIGSALLLFMILLGTILIRTSKKLEPFKEQ